jgi:FKBP-type peptidyl-prolyl cis-trans isomerase
MGPRTFFAYAALLGLCAAGCTSSGFRRQVEVPEPPTFRTPNGVIVHELREGHGEMVLVGRTVTLHLEAKVQGGNTFDSSFARGVPERFVAGTGQTIAGLDEGILGMKAGGRRHLIVPPELAFGELGLPDRVPPGTTLELEVELLAVE